MAARPRRRYRLVSGGIIAAAAVPLIVAGVGSAERAPTVVRLAGGTEGGQPTVNRMTTQTSVTQTQTSVTQTPAETTPAGPTEAGVAPAAARLRLGRFDAPATDAVARVGVPGGVPLVEGFQGQGEVHSLSLTRTGVTPFRAAGVTWQGPADGISVAIRARTGTGAWGPWQTAAPTGGFDAGGEGVRQGARLVWLGAGDAVDVTVVAASGVTPEDVAVDLIDPRELPGDAVSAPPVSSGSTDASRVGRPPIHTRAEWGADERLMSWAPQYSLTVRALAWHDESVGGDYGETDVPRILRALFYYDAVSRGWGDLGDNVLVDRFGRLWEGRYGGLSRAVVAAHTPGRNAGTAGIGTLGGSGSSADATVVEAAARYVAWKLSIGPAVDPRGETTLAPASSTRQARPATVPRVFTTDQAVSDAVLSAVRDRAYALMGAWANPETMRRTLAVWNPANATLTEMGAAAPAWVGQPRDVAVPADYDGDGQLDIATWSPATGVWTIQNSSAGTTESFVLGHEGDTPVPADYDGDGRAEPATFTPKAATWHIRGAADVVYGKPGDRPVPADYNGDGKADLAVYRTKAGLWEIKGMPKVYLGSAWHIPVPADYNGDGKAEPTTFSTQSGLWYQRGKPAVRFGNPGDIPVPAQYNGDGKAHFAVWRPPARGATTGSWMIRDVGDYAIGAAGDVPTTLG
jgi:hypothetical protein